MPEHDDGSGCACGFFPYCPTHERCYSIREREGTPAQKEAVRQRAHISVLKKWADDMAERVTPQLATLPVESNLRKDMPLATGLLDYFPDALADVARLSKLGNDKHNPGEPLHWSREKSSDHADCILRHMVDRGAVDTDTVLHDTKVAWRALAQLQVTIENMRKKGVTYPPLTS